MSILGTYNKKICMVVYKYPLSIDDPCCYPLGFMYVSSHLKARGNKIKVLNYNLWDYDFKEEIKGQDIVCFTGFEEFKDLILRDEKICKELNIQTVIGGGLACFGEMSDFHGEVFKGEIEGATNINNIPYPDYDSFEFEEYNKRHKTKYIGILTTRGCPYSCVFCSQTCKFRMRKIGNIVHEIDLYKKKYGIELISFNDNTLNITKSRFMRLCDAMKDTGVAWGGAIRCFPFDEDMAKKAKESGCIGFVVGIESFIQEKLDKMNKNIKVEQITKTIDALNKFKVPYHGNILVGFNGESIADIYSEILSIPVGVNVFPVVVQPFIGTKMDGDRSITQSQYDELVVYCKESAQNGGMSYYG